MADRHGLSDDELLHMGPIEPDDVAEFLSTIPESQIFTVKFIKADGSVRTMNCRRGVKKYLKGGLSTIRHKKNLVSVFDMRIGEYRCFDINCVLDIK